MEITDHKELLIVGAGPAGLVLSAALSPEIPATIISVNPPYASHHSRATGIQPRVVSILDSLGVLERVKEVAITLTGNSIYVDGEKRYSVSFYNPHTKSHEISIDQRVLEEILEKHLCENDRNVEWKHRLLSLTNAQGTLLADVATEKGEERWSCDYVVGCDGGRSVVRNCSGIPFIGETYHEHNFVLDGIVHGDLDRTSMHYFISQESRIVLVPIGREQVFKVSGAFPQKSDPTINQFDDLVKSHSKGKFYIEPVTPLYTYQMHAKVVTSLSLSERIFLCGDAAHLFPPNGGQGMNVAIEDAYELAQLFNSVAMHYPTLTSANNCENNPLRRYEERLTDIRMRLESVKRAKAKYSYNSLQTNFDLSEEQARVEQNEL